MIKLALQSFINNIRSKLLYSIVNFFALALSIASVVLLLMYVNVELSYDSFHDGDNVYRAESRLWEGDNLTDNWATTSYGHARMIKENIAGVDQFVRVTAQDREQIVSFEDKIYAETKYCYTEPSFFKIFNFPIVLGDTQTPLDRPNCIVLSENAAARYFGSNNPLGKRMTFRTTKSEQHFEVTAIMQNMPENSNLKYDFLLSYNTIPLARQDIWYIHGVYTYLKLQDNTDPRDVEAKFAEISSQYRTSALAHKDWKVELIPLRDIHLNPQKPYEKETKGNLSMLYVLVAMSVALLFIAWGNYLNYTVARSMERAKEMILRKIYGAGSLNVYFQFIIEAFLIHLISSILAFGLILLFIPLLRSMVGVSIEVSSVVFVIIGVILVVGSFVIGLYPAVMLSKIRLVKIMRGNFARSRSANNTRRVLVGLQFIASFVLISGTITVYNQLEFMRNQPLGVETANTIVLKYPSFTTNMAEKEGGFKAKVMGESWTENVTISGAVPGMEVANYFSVRRQGADVKDAKLVQMLAVDKAYINSYKIDMVAGRAFSETAPEDEHKVVINEQTANLLGFQSSEEAVGQMLTIEVLGEPLEVVGVTKNYHQQAPSQACKPILFIIKEKMAMIAIPYISVKVNEDANIEGVITKLESYYKSYFPETPFDYFLLDQYYGNQYKGDKSFASMFAMAALVAMFIAAVGLCIMSLFTMASRIQEIGIRKIYGASEPSLFLLMIRELIIMTIIAMIIGSTISYYLMEQWLAGYAIKVGVDWSVFIVSAVLLFIVGLSTICYQIIKVISIKPIMAIR